MKKCAFSVQFVHSAQPRINRKHTHTCAYEVCHKLFLRISMAKTTTPVDMHATLGFRKYFFFFQLSRTSTTIVMKFMLLNSCKTSNNFISLKINPTLFISLHCQHLHEQCYEQRLLFSYLRMPC